MTCSLGTLSANGSATISIQVAPSLSGLHTNRATVSTSAIDLNQGDNTAQAAVRANASPTLGSISDRTIAEDNVLGPISFTVGDVETPAGSLTLAGFSSNQALAPNSGLVFGGSGANRTLTVTPAPDASGTTIITRIVTDADGASATNSFLLTVTPVNDPPVLADLINRTIDEDTGTGSIAFTISDVETPAAVLSVTGSSSLTSLVPNGSILFSGSGASRAVTIMPATNQSGTVTITITVSDGTNAVSKMFVLTVNAVNDLPTISDLPDRAINEDTATGAMAFTVGDVETAAGSLTLSATSSNPALAPTNQITFGGSGASRTVNVLPATNQFGTALITVTVRDADGGTASNAFTLTVNPVNDSPTLDAISNVATNEDGGLVSLPLTGLSSGATNEIQTLTVTASTTNPGLLTGLTVNYNTGTPTVASVTFTPAPDSNGVASVTVTVNDNVGSNNITTRTFTVTITPVNDAPVVFPIASRTILEDNSTNVIVTVGDVETPATSLSVSVFSSDQSLVSNASLILSGSGSNRNLAITPAPDASGVCMIFVVVSDGDLTGTNSFQLTVIAVNDPPTISAIANRTINEDTGTNVSFTIFDVETPASALTVTPRSSNPALVPNGNLVLGGTGGNRTLAITPAPDQLGVTIISIAVSDPEGASVTNSFTLTVAAVNDPPTLDAINNVSILESAPQQTINLAGISGGPANEPQAVTVTASSSNPGLIPAPQVTYTSGTTGTLRFTPNTSSNGVATLSVTVNDGAASNNLVVRSFTVTVISVNDDPTISSIANVTLNEDTTTNLTFTIGDIETPAGSLTLSALSSNPELITTAGIIFGGSGANRTVTLRPLTNAFGFGSILITVTDADGGMASLEFELDVLAVNDAPFATGLSNATMDEDTVAGPLAFTIGDPDTSVSALTVSLLSSNQALLPTNRITLGGSGASRHLVLAPLTNAFGATLISVIVSDGPLFSTNAFLLTVNSVNDLPAISGLSNLAINEDTATGALPFTIGDVETPVGSLTLSSSSSDTVLVPNASIVFGGSGASRTVSVTPAADRFGITTIRVLVTDVDGGSATNSFVLTVQPVNDPPTLNAIANVTTNEDSGPVTIPLTGIGPGGIGEVQVLAVTATSSNPGFIPHPQVSYTSPGGTGTLTFTPVLDSNGVATITVTVVDDAPTNNTTIRTFTVNLSPVNDSPTLDPIGNLSILEDAPQQTINLSGISGGPPNEPQAVTISAASSNPGLIPTPQVTYSSGATGTLRFTPVLNAFGSATISVTVNDGAASSNLVVRSFTVTVIAVNDDPAISPLANVTLNEDTTTNLTFTMGDIETAAGSLTLSALSSNMELITTAGIVFGGSGSNRTVTLRPLTNAFGFGSILITVTDADGGMASREFELNVLPVNDPPTITAMANVTIDEDTVAGPLAFTIGDPDTSVSALTVSLLSSNQALLPTNRITLGGSGASRHLVLAPLTNAFGATLISVIVSDGPLFSTNAFLLTVNSVNDLPAISGLSNLAINEDTATGALPFTIGDVETPVGSLTLSSSSSDTVLVPNASIVFGGSGASRTVSVNPTPDRFGSATIRVVITDSDGGSATNSFVLTVQPVNDPPAFAAIPNLSTNEDSGPVTITLTGIGPGGIGEVQTLSITATSGNTLLIPNPQITYTSPNATGTLTFTPLPDANGTAVITVRVMDDAPTNNTTIRTFTVTIIAVNDPPTLNPIADLTIAEDSAEQTVSLTGIGTGAANEIQTLTVTATSGNTAVLPHPQVTYSSPSAAGTLRFTPVPDAFGTALITVTVNDGGAENPTIVRTFIVTVTNVNDAPAISALTDRTTGKNMAVAMPVTVDDIDNPPAGLVLAAASANTNLVNAASLAFGGSGGNRTVTILPRTNALGTTLITLTVSDGAGGVASNSFLLTVTNIVAPPILTGLLNTTLAEDTVVTLNYSLSDPEDNASNVVVTIAWSNPSLFSASGLQPGGSGSSRTLRVLAHTNQTGSATVTLTANSSSGLSGSSVFVVTVTNVNDLPTLSSLPNLAINEDTATGPLSFTVGDVETAAASLIVGVTSSNLALLPNGAAVLGGSGSDRTVTLTPVANAWGTSLITLTVNDGTGGSNTTSLLLTVNPVNDLPTLNALSNVTLAVNAPLQNMGLSGISPGPGEIATLLVSASSSNPSLIPSPTVTYTSPQATGTLNFSPLAGATGTSTITVTVNDGGTSNNIVSRSFLVTVNPAAASNSPPTIAAIGNQTILEDTTLVLPVTVSDADTPLLNLVITGTSTNTVLVGNSNIVVSGIGASRTLAVTPSANLSGTTLITLRVSDGMASNSVSFLLTVTAVNDPPTLDALPDLSVLAAFANVTYNLTGISRGPADETTGTLTVTATSSDLNVARVNAVTYTSPNATGSLVITKNNNSATGVAIFSVVVSDGSLSVTQNFRVLVRPSGNNNPTLSTIANQTINENTPSGALPFIVFDAGQTPADLLSVAGRSSNPALVPDSSIVFGGSGSNRTVQVTPLSNQFGTARIYLSVTDTNFGVGTNSFLLTVNLVNTPPTISSIAPQVMNEDTVLGPLAFTVADADSGASMLTVTAVSSNPTLIPNANLTAGGSGTNRAILIRPATNQSGTATITLTVSDGAASASTAFLVTVNDVNDPPAISAISDQTLNEDVSSGAIAFTVADVETAAGSLLLSATSSNPSLLPGSGVLFGGSGANRTLILTPLPDQFGTATLTVTVSDGSLTAASVFVVTVNPVNDPPTLAALGSVSLSQNAGPQTVNLTGISFGPTNEAQTLFITASSSNTGLIPHPAVNYSSPSATGSLTFTPISGIAGTATVTVTVNDAGPVNNITTRTFTVTVNAAPTITGITNLSLIEDTASAPLPFTIADAETAATALIVQAFSSNPSVVAPGGLTLAGTGASRSITLTPVPDQSGFSTISVTVADGSGNITTNTFLVTVVPVNDAPTLAPISNLQLAQNAGQQTVSPSGISSGATNEIQDLIVTAISSNPALIPHPTVNYASPAATGSLAFTPNSSVAGIATITVTVNDGGPVNSSVSRTFTVTVNAAPTITGLTNLSLLEDTASAPLPFTIADAETAATALTVQAFSSNPSVVAPGGLTLAGTGASRSITLTPVPDQSGFSTISVTVADGSGNITTNAFLVTVLSVNDAPTLAPLSNLGLAQNAGPQTVNLSGIGSGAPNENQVLVVTATSGNPSLVPAPTVNYASPAAIGSLTFTPVPGASGSAVITVKVMDDGGTDRSGIDSITRTFTVEVAAAQPPTLEIQWVGGQIVVSWSTNSGSGWKLGFAIEINGPWFAVPGTPSVTAGRYTVTLPASGEAGYFRLCAGCSLPSVPRPPVLTVTRADEEIILSWPEGDGNFVLQVSENVVNPEWFNTGATPVVNAGVASVTLPATGTAQFFRLCATCSSGTPLSPEPPPLTVTRDGDELILQWSVVTGTFVLESAADIVIPEWEPVPATPQVTSHTATVTLSAFDDGQLYFRLRRP